MVVDGKRRGSIVLTLIILLMPFAMAEVVVFDKYTTTAQIEGDSIHIERQVRIKNVGKAPIIPGELHFRLFERKGSDKKPLEINNFEASSERGEELGTKVTTRKDMTDLAVTLWNPLLPGFHYEFTMSYDMKFKPSGILFYELKLPQEETTIPIVNDETSFLLDKGYHVTYAPGSEVNKISGNTAVVWENIDDQRVIEFSRLPLPKIGVRAVNVFWFVIIFALIGIFVVSVRRQRNRSSPVQQQYHNPYQRPPQYGPPPGYGGR